ncbi:Putative NADH-flavin reductase [Brevibacterium iodinum ATCC 49514]|uniref:NADH-flavin reductase n=1 Tax=Brevibacterium iodinum ATCC 49514 TaxID=1255616 RepID=A0A2H1HUP6_9MICO|nr:NAD(P)H-binding protein [Brevibacterium iodinum]SMX66665.1 Putative NADH-flavin reductase [Brevibacterium iodinum ATCC 49514]SUW13595.1 Putative NADH-flavin reductase [Brevibacterium iodinum]
MKVTVFGATGPTGLWICNLALAAGHNVTAVSRRPDPLLLPSSERISITVADAITGTGVDKAVTGADAVLSALGAPYGPREINIYSQGTDTIIGAMRKQSAGNRLVVVSSGLTYPPPHTNFVADFAIFPLLRNVIGRTLYQDMRRMEEELQKNKDIAWTIMRPGRLINSPRVSDYHLDVGHPSFAYTARADLAAAMVDELDRTDNIHTPVAPSTNRHGAQK